MKVENPYHEGEVRVQELAGVRDIALLNGRGIEDRIMAPAFRYLSQLRFFVLGRGDVEQGCEATVLFGPPGFLSAEADGAVLSVLLDPARSLAADPVLATLVAGHVSAGWRSICRRVVGSASTGACVA